MKRLTLILVPTFFLALWCFAKPAAESEEEGLSPHAEAIQLVASTQREAIRKLDPNNWWHDVKERSWTARRPFAPGVFDSTHMFVVTYRIDGQFARSWSVDTGKGTVVVEKAKADGKE